MNPKISIITITYNNKATIAQTIDSVVSQTYQNIEYIVIDGKSSDGTVEIAKSYGSKIHKIISEKDFGIYDAMNKGLRNVTGEIVGFINADDFLHDENVIADLAAAFMESDCKIIYGNKIYVSPENTNKVTRIWKPGIFNKNNFKKGWMPPHLSTYIKKEVYDQIGLFNTNFKIAADYELLFRMMYVNNVKAEYIDRNIVFMRAGGVSNSSLKNYWISNWEVYKSWGLNGKRISPIIIFEKPLRKLKQFI